MYPSGSMVPPPSPPEIREGVRIVVEPCVEWKIRDIGFDGVEKYIRPSTYTDHVGKLARKVNWQKLVGSDAQYDNPSLISDEEDDEDDKKDEDPLKKLGRPEDREIPEAGPWHQVAKKLYESLHQLNILLDNMAVIKSTDYMKPLTILDPIIENASENVAYSKGSQWIWKRKALHEASVVLDKANNQRQRATSSLGLSEDYVSHVQRSQFFEELRQMRDLWRVRKTGDHIYGDLGYHIFGSKYESRALFDITRRALPSNAEIDSSPNKSVLEVTVPRDINRRATLSASIVLDTPSSGNLFRNPDDDQFEYSSGSSEGEKDIHWRNALKWAQNTLICRDTFNRLCGDAVKLRQKMAVVRDNVLLISMYDDVLLRIELRYFPFKEGVLPQEGNPYMNRALRTLIVGQECTRYLRPQMFVSLPITHLPEELDCRGSKAFTQFDIEQRAKRPQRMLEKLIEVGGHYHLVEMCNAIVEKFAMEYDDPCILHRYIQMGFRKSKMIVSLSSKFYDHFVNKSTFFITIFSDKVQVNTKEGQTMECNRDMKQLEHCIRYMVCSFLLSSVASLAKAPWLYHYQIMYANVNSMNSRLLPAPTLVLCNQIATRAIMIQFHIDALPEVKVRKFIANENQASQDDYVWTKLDYTRMLGSTLCRKMDNLFAFMKDLV